MCWQSAKGLVATVELQTRQTNKTTIFIADYKQQLELCCAVILCSTVANFPKVTVSASANYSVLLYILHKTNTL